jgi:hypothetical protein
LVVFEIDGPIIDQRHTVRRRLLDYELSPNEWCTGG